MYVCIYVSMYHFATVQIQYDINFNVKNVKGITPLITVAGIALKGQADLIPIMLPLEVLGQQQKMNE